MVNNMYIVKATPVQAYKIEKDGKELGIFHQKSEWNGMLDLRNPENGNQLIVSGLQKSLFDDVFQGLSGPEEKTAIVHMCSPDLAITVKGENNEK